MPGSRAIFTGKSQRYQGIVTPLGAGLVEQARIRLALLVGRLPSQVSDGDTIEYLARGDKDARTYIAAKQRPT